MAVLGRIQLIRLDHRILTISRYGQEITAQIMSKIWERHFPREHLLEKEKLFDSDSDSANSCFLEAIGDSQEDKAKFVCYQWDVYTVGYKYAADLIVKKGVATNGLKIRLMDPKCGYHTLANNTDIVLYPVIFLYRQYLENRLKAIIMKNKVLELMESGGSINTKLLIDEFSAYGHKLPESWKRCEEIIRNRRDEKLDSDDEMELRIMGEYIKEYSKMDEKSDTLRYPMDKKGKLFYEKYAKDVPKAISLKNLCKIMDKIFFYFELQNALLDAEIEVDEWAQHAFHASF